ncbi:MAG: hypothetical protein HYW79_02995 [Parcubacteria group bacterium]|nr:hypothetical protein [Parcubacteria group bacterium]
MAKSKNKRGPPLSGDHLVDWHFRLILDAIHRQMVSVKKKKILTNPDHKDPQKRRETLYGLYDYETKEVFISASKCKHPTKMSMVRALIHEIYHKITPDVLEKRVYRIENILMIRFTDEQKRYLKKFIPRHEVKKGPTPKE